jgi:hypothetical protein
MGPVSSAPGFDPVIAKSLCRIRYPFVGRLSEVRLFSGFELPNVTLITALTNFASGERS